MSNPQLITLLLAAMGALASWAVTASVRRYAIRAELIDKPNLRSSHTLPTPRGGGVGIVFSLGLVLTAMLMLRLVERDFFIAIVGAGGLVAALGFIDDHVSLQARWRFLGHIAASAWVLFWLPPLPAVPIFGIPVNLAYAGPVLGSLYIAWMINLFNFMDGIDGLASVEAITTALGGGLLWWLTGHGSGWMGAVVFAGCVVGFLAWNFPPAKIFMGDAGSGFLGLMVALLSLWSGQATPALFWSWFILIGCFMVDATTTLIRRVRRGERFFEAHRNHAYQYASRRLGAHLPVTLTVGAINLLWLLPLAAVVALGWLDGLAGVVIAYAPLVWLAFHFHAGDRAAQLV